MTLNRSAALQYQLLYQLLLIQHTESTAQLWAFTQSDIKIMSTFILKPNQCILVHFPSELFLYVHNRLLTLYLIVLIFSVLCRFAVNLCLKLEAKGYMSCYQQKAASFHPFILYRGSRGQQTKQEDTDFPLPSYIDYLFQGIPRRSQTSSLWTSHDEH